MTPYEYLQWLDKEIEEAKRLVFSRDPDRDTNQHYISCHGVLCDVREKFLTIDFDTQPTDPKNFTEGLE